jgi:hypothetical protein
VRTDVARFGDARFGPRRIATRPQALAELLDGLEIVAAKRWLRIVLDLVPSTALDEEAVTSEFVLEDRSMALGRLRFGSPDAAVAALRDLGGHLALALLDGADPATTGALKAVLPNGVVPYRSDELELEYLGDVALARAAAEDASAVCIVDPGTYAPGLVDALAARVARGLRIERVTGEAPDRAGAVIVVAGPSGSAGGPGAQRAIHLGTHDPSATAAAGIVLRREDAYRDTLPRWERALMTRPELELAHP